MPLQPISVGRCETKWGQATTDVSHDVFYFRFKQGRASESLLRSVRRGWVSCTAQRSEQSGELGNRKNLSARKPRSGRKDISAEMLQP